MPRRSKEIEDLLESCTAEVAEATYRFLSEAQLESVRSQLTGYKEVPGTDRRELQHVSEIRVDALRLVADLLSAKKK